MSSEVIQDLKYVAGARLIYLSFERALISISVNASCYWRDQFVLYLGVFIGKACADFLKFEIQD